MSTVRTFIELPPELAEQMPEKQAERQQVIALGLTQWRIEKSSPGLDSGSRVNRQ